MSGADDLARVALDYRRMGTAITAQLIRDLAEVGQDVIREADANAPASKIHGSMSAQSSIRAAGISVALRIHGAKSRGAGPAFEQIAGASTFRHPLFGNRDRWYEQAAQPFLAPALAAHAPDAERRMGDVVEKAARASGF